MKKLDVSAVTNAAQMKLKAGTLQFLQDANAEAFAALCLALIGSSYSASQVYVLWGCINSGSTTDYDISAGAIFYDGEIYLVDAATFSLNANVAIFSPITTQYTTNADPMTFSDSSIHNIHNIRKMRILGGATGTMNYETRKGILEYLPAQLNLTADGAASISGTYPNIKVSVPANSNRNPVLYAGSFNVGNPAGNQAYTITFPTIGTNNYYVMGIFVSNPTSVLPEQDATLTWVIRAKTNTGFTLQVHELGNFTQDVSFEYIIFAQ